MNTKFLNSKFFVIGIVLISLIISFFQAYKSLTYIPLDVEFNQTSLVVALKNGQYFVLRPEADIIDDKSSQTIRPFQQIDSFNNSVIGFNLAWMNETYYQKVQSGNNSRELELRREGANGINLNDDINTNYSLTKNFNYQIQLDYSRESEIIYNDDSVVIKDIDCSITIYKDSNYTISDFGNRKSLIIKQVYSSSMNFDINMKIESN